VPREPGSADPLVDPPGDLGRWRRLPALAVPAYRRFLFGAILSNIGSWMQATAQGWLVLGLTNSATLLGVTSAAANLPILMLSLYAGVLADRIDQRRLLVVTQIAAAIFTAILALLTTLGAVQFWHVLVIAFLVGSTSAMSAPAYQALVSSLVGPRALGNAIALNSAQFNFSRIVGPSFAGIGIALGGIALSFWANSVSFVVVALVLATLPIRNTRAIGRLEASLWANIADGLRYARSAPPVPTLLLLTVAPALLNLNYLVFLPIFARDILGIGAPGLGLMTSAVGVGAVTGALVVGIARPGGGSGRLVIAALIASSTGLLIFALSTWLPLTLLGLAILGGCQVGYYATTNTLLQLLVPIRLRGRVMSLYILTSTGLTPFGNLVVGPIADRIGVQTTLAACALITILICSLVGLRSRGLRDLRASAVATPA
jgi:MFS family permease